MKSLGRAGNVLLIEDNPDHVILIQTALEDSPQVQQVTVMSDGEQALRFVQSQTPTTAFVNRPGLVVLDLKLPKVDGLDVLRAIRASAAWRMVPVVVLTTSTRPADEAASYASGANAYVAKVMQPLELAHRVREMVARWLGQESGWDRALERASRQERRTHDD